MNSDQSFRLESIRDLLSELDEEFSTNNTSTRYLCQRDGEREIVISGNKEGLLHFAGRILELCLRDAIGAHEHFDTAGIMDECDRPIVVAAVKAPWDA